MHRACLQLLALARYGLTSEGRANNLTTIALGKRGFSLTFVDNNPEVVTNEEVHWDIDTVRETLQHCFKA
jgi:hypothetical protein